MPASTDIFSDLLIGSALGVQIGILIPIMMHYSQRGEEPKPLKGWFAWPASLTTAALTAYLIAALDFKVMHQQDVWDVFWIALVLLASMAIIFAKNSTTQPKIALSHAANDVDTGRETSDVSSPRSNQQERRSSLQVCKSSAEYAAAIIDIERSATRIDRMTKRVSAIFKDPVEVAAIADRRFGPGSRQAEAYLAEHRERHRLFIENLSQHRMVCREIYQFDELRRYFISRKHGGDIVLEKELLRRTVMEWIRAQKAYPTYYVGITTDPIPLKYQIINQSTMVLHEAAGSLDGQRVNAIIVRDEQEIEYLVSDFENVWERIPIAMRTKEHVIDWIKSTLLPLLEDGNEQPPSAS